MLGGFDNASGERDADQVGEGLRRPNWRRKCIGVLSESDLVAVDAFRPAALLGHPDAQTIFATLWRPRPGPPVARERWELPDGDFLDVDRLTIAAKDPLPKGKTKLVVNFAYDGGGLGKGGAVTITANGNKIAEGLERTVPVQFSIGDGFDVGLDTGSAVDFTYKLPFKFTGTIEKVEIDLAPKK